MFEQLVDAPERALQRVGLVPAPLPRQLVERHALPRDHAGGTGHPADAAELEDDGRDVRRGAEDAHPVAHPVQDRQDAPRAPRGVFDITDVRYRAQRLDHFGRQVGHAQPRIRVEDDRARHRPGDRAEIALDPAARDRELRLEHHDQPICAQLHQRLGLPDRIGRRKRRHAGDDRHTPRRRVQHDPHDLHPLLEREVGNLPGTPQRAQPVHALRDQVLHQIAQHFLPHPPRRLVDRRHQVRDDPMKLRACHRHPLRNAATNPL